VNEHAPGRSLRQSFPARALGFTTSELIIAMRSPLSS
jgi:hypothetical protein